MEKLITILGPTAAGKTGLAAKLAYRFNGEIISADSRQVYRGMDLGTGKDYADYNVNGTIIPSHLIDITEPDSEFNLFEFAKYFLEAFSNIKLKSRLPIMCGGTGLYISAVVQNYKLRQTDFNSAKRAKYDELPIEELRALYLKYDADPHVKRDLDDRERLIKGILIGEEEDSHVFELPKFNNLILGVKTDRDVIKKRITKRLEERLNAGMIDEVKALLDKGVPAARLIAFGLEYKFITQHITGELNYNDMFQKLNSSIAAFAKRQMTWYRKMEREGVKFCWLNGPDLDAASALVEEFLDA
jgi:tRNA dimethylallyltransferase